MFFRLEYKFRSSELGVWSFQHFSESLFFKDFINPLSILESSEQNPRDCFLSSILINFCLYDTSATATHSLTGLLDILRN